MSVKQQLCFVILTRVEAEAVGVAGVEGAEGREAPLWEAEDEERVGEALREPGLERRPRERKAANPVEAPSGRMNFSRSSRLVRPRAADRQRGGEKEEGEWPRSSLCTTAFLQQGAAEAASRVRERVGASLRLQTSESVQDFGFFFFYLRVFGEQSGCLFRECLKGIRTP